MATTVPQGTTGSSDSLANWAGPYVTQLLGQTNAYAAQPYAVYQGPLTAGTSQLQSQAFQGIAGLQVPGAVGQATNTAGGIAQSAQQGGQYTPTTFKTGLEGLSGSPYNIDTIKHFANEQGLMQPGGGAVPSEQNYQRMYDYASQYGIDPKQVDMAMGWDPGTSEGYVQSQGMEKYWERPIGTVQQYMNPYQQGVIDVQAREARRQAEISRNADQARLTKAGAYGGGRQAILDAERSRNLHTQIGDIQATGLQAAYDRAQQQRLAESGLHLQAQAGTEGSRQFGAELGLRGLNTALDATRTQMQGGQLQNELGLGNLKALMDAGGVQRDIESQGVTADYNEFLQQRDYPMKMLQLKQSMLQGLPIGAVNYAQQQPSSLANIMNTTGGLMQLYNQLFTPTTTTPK